MTGNAIDAATGKGTCCQCTNTTPTSCHTGVLRMLDGRTGAEIWSLDKAKCPNEPLQMLNVPGLFAFDPAALLVPADALNAATNR